MISQLLYALAQHWTGKNRRQSSRIARVTYIEIQPLDEDFSVCGPVVWGITRDFSQQGIGFTTKFWLNCTFVSVTIPEDNRSIIGVVRHNNAFAIEPYSVEYMVGIELLDEKSVL